MDNFITKAAEFINNADALFISAGAGMGVDSGLPDFRGREGFLKAYPVLGKEGLSFQDVANPAWFILSPERAWGFYGHRYFLYQKTNPHKGFELLKKWCDSKDKPSFVFTSNVDGHFQKAGFSSDQVLECHGSINHLQCSLECSRSIWQSEDYDFSIDADTLQARGELPTCPTCGAVARPNILMFNDRSWFSGRTEKQQQSYNRWLSVNRNKKIAVIEIGAGKVIPSVRLMSEAINGSLIRINPRDADGPDGTLSIPLGALDALTKIDKAKKSYN